MKLDVDVKIYEATTKSFKDYKLNSYHYREIKAYSKVIEQY